MKILLLKGFNNYANRIIVRYETLQEYEERAQSYLTYSDINFNPNDGVITELVFGNEVQQVSSMPLDWEDTGSPDYLVCFKEETIEEETVTTILSRWFVVESVRTRLGQYKLTLKRDSIADHLESVVDATCFIEKGIIESKEDSAIYNKEDITTNQIKSDEFLLKDETQCGWIVGYVAKDREESGTLTPTTFTEQTIEGPEADDDVCDEVFTSIDDFWSAHPELSGELASLNSWAATVKLDIYYGKLLSWYRTGQTITCYNTGNVSYKESAYENSNYLHSKDRGGNTIVWKNWSGDYRSKLANSFVSGWKGDTFKSNILGQIASKENVIFTDSSTLQKFFDYVNGNPTVKIGTKYYKPFDKFGGEGAKSTITNSSFITLGSTAYDLMYNGLDLTPSGEVGEDVIEGTPGPETFSLEWSYNKHALGLREIFSECKAKVPVTVPVLKDAPYHMFAIPYSDDLAIYDGNTLHCVTNKSVAMNAAQALATNAGAGVVYDIQLLPYCPIRDIIKTDKKTAHAEISPATYEQIPMKLRRIGKEDAIVYFDSLKLNHQYVIQKDASLLDSSQRAWGIKSQSPIYVKVGEDLEDPSNIYIVKKVEVRYADVNDLTSDRVIYLYNEKESVTPDYTFDFDTYVSGDDYIGVYITDSFEGLTVTSTLIPPVTYTLGYTQNIVPYVNFSLFSNAQIKFVSDYIYYEDYYLNKIDLANVTHSDIVPVVGGVEGTPVNVIFWATSSQFSFNKFLNNYFLLQEDGSYKQDEITQLLSDKVKVPELIKDIKVRNQIDMLRIASPNYSNFFDINVQRNKGVEYINVDCTYKPYAPYIHLNPNFKGLYGADYNDVRGLICGGDYSIALTTDAWATYQLQNKNYQAVFDRQIQQLEVAQSIQQQSDIVNAIAGVGTGAIGGALVGAKVGGGYGAMAGAVAGAMTSAVGGMADVYNNERMRELQISTMKDIRNYQLDNIKALPLGLSKTSYLTNNNKLFPFLEFYTCTPIEEQAVRDKLDYNGMKINRVGKISEFQSEDELPYIKAQLIRINMHDDAHQAKAISDELAIGVYLPRQEPEGDNE